MGRLPPPAYAGGFKLRTYELEAQQEKQASTAEMLRDLVPVLKLGDDIGTELLGTADASNMEAPVITHERATSFKTEFADYTRSGKMLDLYRNVCGRLIETYLEEVGRPLKGPDTRSLLEVFDSLTTVLTSDIKSTDFLRNGEGGDGMRIGVKLRAEVDLQKTKEERHATYAIVRLVHLGNPRADALADVLEKRWEL